MRHRTFLMSLLVLWILAWSSSGNRLKRDVVCMRDIGYIHDDICCLNCPAGTFVKVACSRAFDRGVCQPCAADGYTEFVNGLFKCLNCTKCRSDQELVEPCSPTSNTQCQCKAGSYCLPDQVCEVCRKCKKCKEDEELMKSCTAQSNTVCEKRGSTSANVSTDVVISLVVIIIIILILFIVCIVYWRKSARCKNAAASRWTRRLCKMCFETGSNVVEAKQNSMNGAFEEGANMQPFICQTQSVGETLEDEEDIGLGLSLPNTTASSQISLPAFALTNERRPSRSLPQQLNTLENEKPRRLIPLNGDESLKKSFDLFGEIDVNFRNRFFRLLDLNDNTIRGAEGAWCSHEDRVYELLKTWMEKEGMKADFNTLIDALHRLDQRMSAENIVARAIDNGYFRYEEN